MTSETETLKTNEFLRRRKLRLQQVREQSKVIAKKIRQRAKVETLRQVVELDAKKQKEYFDRQDKLVQHLEILYSRGLNNVGASHQSACELNQQDENPKTDLSKLRGKEAAAELRKKRQEKLDQQKKLLDRRLQAREAANEFSRDKSSAVTNKLLLKPSQGGDDKNVPDTTEVIKDTNQGMENKDVSNPVTKNDMGTQWETNTLTNEWTQCVPTLLLPKDDQDKGHGDSKLEKNKRLDLFALSKEMPSDLRGAVVEVTEPRSTARPSLTLVSEYLQNRKLRLRTTEIVPSVKKVVDDMSSLKQTIQRTRATKPEAAGKGSVCTDTPKADSVLAKKSSISMYNHYTRNVQDLPCSEENLVVRDEQSSEDAYSQAMKESESVVVKDLHDVKKKAQDMRNKVAVAKQTVEKEYKDTIKFLNSLPKDGNKVTKTTYMDERQQQMQKDKRQHRMQQEYRKIEKECRRHHSCLNKSYTSQPPVKHRESKFDQKDFQYSWMPVPEGDNDLAVHTIPNSTKEKSCNSVRFSKVDSYHEYRSRHKHTPPTKDKVSHDKQTNKKCFKTVFIDKNSSNSSDEFSTASNTSSAENLNVKNTVKDKQDTNLDDNNSSDAERIIIYKILDTKTGKKSKNNTKILSDIAKSLTSIEKIQKAVVEENPSESDAIPLTKRKPGSASVNNSVSFEQINEGIYKVTETGDNMASIQNYDSPDTNARCPVARTVNQQCQHMQQDYVREKGPIPQWEDGDIYTNKTSKACNCKYTSTRVRPATTNESLTATSYSSFKTASNDKAVEVTEQNYIKLVDETGLEAGKFYLGAANLLKDSAYEVVIQLRKKDGPTVVKEIYKSEQAKSEVISSVNVQSEESKPLPSNTELQEEKDIPAISPITCSESESAVVNDKIDVGVSNNSIINNEDVRLQTSEVKREVAESYTNFREDEVKFDPTSRPATSTYTQTLNSPLHRPMYLQMSSSTSTAYMSPPEIIVPNFMRHDRSTENELSSEDIGLYNRGKYDKVNKKCKHIRKSHSDINVRRETQKKYTSSTPPNTPRSNVTKHSNSDLQKPKTATPCKESNTDKTKCTCPSCGFHHPPKARKKQCMRNKNIHIKNNQTYQNLNKNFKINVDSRNKSKTPSSSHSKKGSMDIMIRDYINKLLALNKEGMKAVEVADQDCSSVGTPGSSIINVPFNVDERLPMSKNITLEQIKKMLSQQILKDNLTKYIQVGQKSVNLLSNKSKPNNYLLRQPRKKTIHKVKSLNISKHLLKQHKNRESKQNKPAYLSSTTDDYSKTIASSSANKSQSRTPISPSYLRSPKPLSLNQKCQVHSKKLSKMETKINKPKINSENIQKNGQSSHKKENTHNIQGDHDQFTSPKSTGLDSCPDTDLSKDSHDYYKNKVDIPTQTCRNSDNDFVKVAEDKLLNMEKIADLTEKCTKRLSNLAKVLEEVRKSKSSAYSQISTSDSNSTVSQSDQKSVNVETPLQTDTIDVPNNFPSLESPKKSPEKINIGIEKENTRTGFIPFLSDVPKCQPAQLTDSLSNKVLTDLFSSLPASPVDIDKFTLETVKCRPKPPPALSRIHLKHNQEYITPHELSTVMEVDSPLSIKTKNQSSRNEGPSNASKSPHDDKITSTDHDKSVSSKETQAIDLPGSVPSNLALPKVMLSPTEAAGDSKFQMIDLKQFNEIMLEPFISIHEYAKKYNMEVPDEGSKTEDLHKDDAINDDISSLHSDGSLPDVIAELLKRNIITEPFKFDTGSNINSNTLSSESTLSLLALSKARKVKRSNVMFQNKENIGETSDSLSVSSNPDLENAFKRLGMGWASSTLKKTKERLALSSSSNTSSSSLQQYKIKTFNQEIPALITDSVSSVLLSKKGMFSKNDDDSCKHAEQQTSFPNSMFVKEFLTNELADKITFNKTVNDSVDEFVSLFETKMPEGLKQQTLVNEQTNDSVRSGVNRARTSTPVQLYKSTTFHSSSSSNLTNSLFSNAEDLSSVKMTSNSIKYQSTSEKDDLTIPNFSLRMKKSSDCSKSD